ncbi:MAG TPA: DciA family protein [Patescibacteria group bacterium]|nr:DciA family protein [Patescibacteria group bacterium]
MTNKKKGFAKIGFLLDATASRRHWEGVWQRQRALAAWQGVAAAFLEETAELTRAIGFDKGVLTVACLSKAAASRIRLLSQNLITALNEWLGRRLVYAIYLEV